MQVLGRPSDPSDRSNLYFRMQPFTAVFRGFV